MIRVVLVLFAVLVAVLALVFDEVWLYAVAALCLAAALVLIARSLFPKSESGGQHGSRSGTSGSGAGARAAEDPMERVGIVGVQAREKKSKTTTKKEAAKKKAAKKKAAEQRAAGDRRTSKNDAERTGASGKKTNDPTTRTPGHPEPSGATGPTSEARPAESASASGPSPARSTHEPAPAQAASAPGMSSSPGATPSSAEHVSNVAVASPDDAPFMGHYLEAVREVLQARIVALVIQEEMVPDYRVEALVGGPSVLRNGAAFSTQQPLLTASTAHQSVTVHPLASPEPTPDYDPARPPTIKSVALAPLTRHTSPDLSFLLVDADYDLDTARVQTVLEQLADTLALVLDTQEREPTAWEVAATENGSVTWDEDDLIGQETPVADASRVPAHRPAPNDPEPDDDVTPDEDAPRPRGEIIAEEMEKAHQAERPLSLVLVHLNRADALDDQGEETVQRAEHELRQYLQECAPHAQVVRFGEVTYGVFVHEPVDIVCDWAVDLHGSLAYEEGILRGGSSVGVAVWNGQDPPNAFRADATEALRDSYMSGHCSVID